MRTRHADYLLDDTLDAFDFAACHHLLSGAYWSTGITRRDVEHGFRNSTIVVGAYSGATQVGCARIVSDKTRFAFVMDVIVAEDHRRRGLGRAMVRFLLEHPELALVYRFALVTNDAQGVYAGLGFGPLAYPERWMTLEKKREWLSEPAASPA
jgi:ribosomal protein S18 acetylase RimI-like enzyme